MSVRFLINGLRTAKLLSAEITSVKAVQLCGFDRELRGGRRPIQTAYRLKESGEVT